LAEKEKEARLAKEREEKEARQATARAEKDAGLAK